MSDLLITIIMSMSNTKSSLQRLVCNNNCITLPSFSFLFKPPFLPPYTITYTHKSHNTTLSQQKKHPYLQDGCSSPF